MVTIGLVFDQAVIVRQLANMSGRPVSIDVGANRDAFPGMGIQ